MPFLAPLALPLMAIGTAVSAGSAVMGGISQAAALKSQAKGAEYNAAVARQNAEIARQAGDIEAGRIREAGRRTVGQQENIYGSLGLEFEGSPLLIMEETAANFERDALMARYGYEIKARRAESEAGQYDFMAGRARSMAPGALFSGLLGGATSLLSGGAQIGRGYQKGYFKK